VKFCRALIPLGVLLICLTFGVRRISDRRFSPETAVVQGIKFIHTAQVQYSSQYGHYAPSLSDLADLVGTSFVSAERQGYRFTMTGNEDGYQIRAVPDSTGADHRRTFYSDQTMVIRVSDTRDPATDISKELGAK
jgi:hypothetical protein